MNALCRRRCHGAADRRRRIPVRAGGACGVTAASSPPSQGCGRAPGRTLADGAALAGPHEDL